MRIISLSLGLSLLVTSVSAWSNEACDLSLYPHPIEIADSAGDRVTPYWAQEAVGAYETKAFFKTINVGAIPIELWDGGFLGEDLLVRRDLVPSLSGVDGASEFLRTLGEVSEDKKVHGSKSLRLLMSQAPESLNYNFTLHSLGFTHNHKVYKLTFPAGDTNASIFVSRALGFSPEQSRFGGSIDELLTYYDWPQFNRWSKNSDGVSEPKFYVNAAGNGYLFHFTREGMWDYAGGVGVPLLFVSSVLANGEYDNYSGGGPKILVSGPGGDDDAGVLLPEENGKTGRSFFTRTSAATQFVSSGLAMTSGLLGELSANQINELLKATSIKTGAFPQERNFGGYGVINHYLLARVAHKISQSGRDLTPAVLAQSLGELKQESDSLFRIARSGSTASCQDTLETLKNLRQAFFLNPNNSSIRLRLKRLYADNSYSQQARYYSPVSMESISPEALERHILMLLTDREVDEVTAILDRRPETEAFFASPNYTATFLYAAEVLVSEKIVDLVRRIEQIAAQTDGGQRGYEAYRQGFARDAKSLAKNPYLANYFFDFIPIAAFSRDEMLAIWTAVTANLPGDEWSKWRLKFESYGVRLSDDSKR